MKAYLSINQKAFINIANSKNRKVDYIDGALFDWINTFTHSQKALKKLIDNKLFIWVSYTAIREDNPMANITSNDVVGRRLNKLVELGILEKFLSKEDGNKVFFHITQFAYDYLLESRELPTQKSEPLPTQKSDNSKLNNSKLDSNKKNTKKKISTTPKVIIDFFKVNISNKNFKLQEQSSYTQLALHKNELDLILTGLMNYAKALPDDDTFIKALPNFIKNKIYLDYQEEIIKVSANKAVVPIDLIGKKYCINGEDIEFQEDGYLKIEKDWKITKPENVADMIKLVRNAS